MLYRPAPRVDGRGEFFAPLLARLYSDSIPLTALAASSSRCGGSGDFSLSPFPLMLVLSCLRTSISPPPPGVGCANGRTICGCGRDGGLLAFIVSCRSLAERSFAFVLPDVRVFLSCLVFFLLTGSGLGGRHWAPSSFRPVFPVPCVSYCVLAFRPCLIRRVRSDRRPCFPVLALAIAWRCRVILSVRSACFVHLGLARPRVGLASFRPSPRLACRRTGR